MIWFIFTLLLSLVINIAMFVPAYLYKTDKLTDISYSITFIVLAVMGFGLSNKQPIQVVLLILVIIWALRLGSFLFYRIQNIKRDKRFDGMRDNFGRFIKFWLLQGLTVPVVLLAVLLADSNSNPITTGPLTVLGALVFIGGLIIESIADLQKFKFKKSDKSNSWIDVGIWRISRHPNYLGEIFVWFGIYIVSFEGLIGINKVVGLIGPAYIAVLLLFVSGIPLLEKAADAKWEQDASYREYKNSVPRLLPSPASIRRLGIKK